jgi:hypothetical protein
MNPQTGAITGTPTAGGTGSFTIQATDTGSAAQTATQTQTNFSVIETGIVTVTATSGELVNTTQIAVTVQ